MFGAWQAGAWKTLSRQFQPDLVVGASVGSLNGYAIASGWSPDELCDWWLRPGVASFAKLPATITALVQAKPLQLEYATVVVDLLRMKPLTIPGSIVRSEHLLASCSVPGKRLPLRIDGRWYIDGGLLNPLPVWVAVELGAQRILGLNALPQIPSAVLVPFVRAFRAVFGHNPPKPQDVQYTTLVPGKRLGSLRDAITWNAVHSAQWIAQGEQDALQARFP